MNLCDLTVIEAHEGLKNREFSSRELTLSCLQRIDEVEDKLNAFITVTAEGALEKADEVDKRIAAGENIPPLAGIPVAIKDIFCTKDVETTAGSNILRGFIPPYDATVVKKLKSQDVVIIGKTNCDAFAHGSSGENSDFGPTKNPWDRERVPGGSSSGSAASVASGEAIFALCTDTGGSTRLPSGFCGLVGLKPTYGRVSRYGVIAMASSLDSPGPIAKTVSDCALVAEVLAGHDPLDSTAPKVPVSKYGSGEACLAATKDLKVGVPKEYFQEGIEPEVEKLVRKAIQKLEELGATAVEISLPHTKYGVATYALTCHSEVSSNLARYDGIRFGQRRKSFGDEAKRRIMLGTFALSSGYYDQYYQKAQKVRTLIKRDFDEAFKKVDVIITPTSPGVPFKLGEKVDDPLMMYLSDIFMVPVNLAGLPALNLPCGFSNNLPVGMQIIGPQFSEPLLFRMGYTYEQSCEWSEKRCQMANVESQNQM
jgi:aspartyl-tRNA(Asn)/glutamyl-tRNA(Gln) amidotransferase subunit A